MKHSQIWNKLIIIIHIVTWMTMIDDSVGNSHHITGPFYQYDGFTFLEKTLFTRNSTTAKSYIVGFKYVGDVTSTVIYSGVIQSNAQNTHGSGTLSNGIDIYDNHYLNAEIHIPDAMNFEVDIKLTGMAGIGYVGMSRFLRLKIFRPRSSALICAIDRSRPQTPYRQLEFGSRKAGDVILLSQKNIVGAAGSQLPRHKIEFHDDNVVLTSILIRLNSTKAIVFHNKVQLTRHNFSSTIYGLDRDAFASVLIIYGFTA